MAIEFTVEAEGNLTLDTVRSSISDAGGTVEVDGLPGRLIGYFQSGLAVYGSKEELNTKQVLAGESLKVSWKPAWTIVFRLSLRSYDQSVAEMKRTIEEISRLSPARFVLSHDFSEPYAIRDESGLRFIRPILKSDTVDDLSERPG